MVHILGWGLCILAIILIAIRYRARIIASNEISDEDDYDYDDELEDSEPHTCKISIFDSNYNLVKEFKVECIFCERDQNPLFGYIDANDKNHFIYIKGDFIVHLDEL